MLACPRCKNVVSEDQLFCRNCGTKFDSEFQFSLRGFNLPVEKPIYKPNFELIVPRTSIFYRLLLPVSACILIVGIITLLPTTPSSSFYDKQSATISKIDRSYLGVYLATSDSEWAGAVIDNISELGPAERAGLRSGDIIVEANSRTISSPDELVDFLTATPAGSDITLKVVRDHREFYVNLTTASRAELRGRPSPQQGFLGVAELDQVDIETTQFLHSCELAIGAADSRLLSASTHTCKPDALSKDSQCTHTAAEYLLETNSAVRIGRVLDGTAAAKAGLKEGDIVLAVDGNLTRTPEELSRWIRSRALGQKTSLALLRDGQLLYQPVTMGRR